MAAFYLLTDAQKAIARARRDELRAQGMCELDAHRQAEAFAAANGVATTEEVVAIDVEPLEGLVKERRTASTAPVGGDGFSGLF